MSNDPTEQTEREKFISEMRERLLAGSKLSPEEVEEFVRFERVAGPSTVEEQIRRYYLMIKQDRPDKAEEMMAEIGPYIRKKFRDERDLHDPCVILSRYIHGFVLHLPPTAEMEEEMRKEFPMPLKIRTMRLGSKPCRIWRRKSEWVKWKAWRRGRPLVVGYGMTERKAIEDLRYRVQPDHTGELDGKGRPSGPIIGGNMLFTSREQIRHNKAQLKK